MFNNQDKVVRRHVTCAGTRVRSTTRTRGSGARWLVLGFFGHTHFATMIKAIAGGGVRRWRSNPPVTPPVALMIWIPAHEHKHKLKHRHKAQA